MGSAVTIIAAGDNNDHGKAANMFMNVRDDSLFHILKLIHETNKKSQCACFGRFYVSTLLMKERTLQQFDGLCDLSIATNVEEDRSCLNLSAEIVVIRQLR
jgi:hypothetical protein